ncbi:MAG: hypothetical protein ACE5FP_01915 [Gemmatimonadota bacterium]
MRVRSAFLALIIVQTFHSAEEYVFRLYDVFPPARASGRSIGRQAVPAIGN